MKFNAVLAAQLQRCNALFILWFVQYCDLAIKKKTIANIFKTVIFLDLDH